MINLLTILVRRRRLLFGVSAVSAVAAAGISFLLPSWYRAGGAILPPQRDASLPVLADITDVYDLPYSGYILEGRMGSLLYIDILKSRTVGEEVIEKHDLQAVYGAATLDETLAIFHRRTFVELLPDGVVRVAHEEQDPALAAEVANSLILALDTFYRTLNTTRGGMTRRFVEAQLAERRGLLSEAEEALRAFREEHGAVELGEQMRAVIEMVADLRAREIALEMDVALAERVETVDSRKRRLLETQLGEVRSQLEELVRGSGDETAALLAMGPDQEAWAPERGVNPDASNAPGREGEKGPARILPPIGEVPRLMMEAARLDREVEIHGRVVSLLAEQLERSRIEETKDTPTLDIIDLARVPEKRTRPKRGFLVLLATLVMATWTALAILVWERFLEHGLAPGEDALIARAQEALRSDLGFFLRRRGRGPPDPPPEIRS